MIRNITHSVCLYRCLAGVAGTWWSSKCSRRQMNWGGVSLLSSAHQDVHLWGELISCYRRWCWAIHTKHDCCVRKRSLSKIQCTIESVPHFVVVFKLLVDNFIHYIVHYRIPTMHSKLHVHTMYPTFYSSNAMWSCFSEGEEEVVRKPEGFANVG